MGASRLALAKSIYYHPEGNMNTDISWAPTTKQREIQILYSHSCKMESWVSVFRSLFFAAKMTLHDLRHLVMTSERIFREGLKTVKR